MISLEFKNTSNILGKNGPFNLWQNYLHARRTEIFHEIPDLTFVNTNGNIFEHLNCQSQMLAYVPFIYCDYITNFNRYITTQSLCFEKSQILRFAELKH